MKGGGPEERGRKEGRGRYNRNCWKEENEKTKEQKSFK